MTNKELQDKLKEFSDDMEVLYEEERGYENYVVSVSLKNGEIIIR